MDACGCVIPSTNICQPRCRGVESQCLDGRIGFGPAECRKYNGSSWDEGMVKGLDVIDHVVQAGSERN